MVEEQVAGGGVTAVSRVDGTIRRTTGWWSGPVQALLRYLEASGFGPAPRFLGTDEQGREILSELRAGPAWGPSWTATPSWSAPPASSAATTTWSLAGPTQLTAGSVRRGYRWAAT
jgi:hypothetical protein